MKLKTQLFGKSYQFKDVKQVLAKANELRSGDVLAGVVAESSQERVAAKQVLSEMTIADIRMNPVIPYEEDCVTRIIQDDINETAYARVKNWSISELREYIWMMKPAWMISRFYAKGSAPKWWLRWLKFAPTLI